MVNHDLEARQAPAVPSVFVRNTWYAVAWTESFAQTPVLGRRILNEPLAIFRRENGEFAALADTCPHRYAPLHLGALRPGDRLQCPYHGLEFDVSGHCVHNPHGSGRIPRFAQVQSYPVLERHGVVWIWMGAAASDPDSIPDLSAFASADPAWTSKRDYLRLGASYVLLTENLLDLSHTSFLHKGILGDEDTIAAEIRVQKTPGALLVSRHMPNVRAPGLFDLLFKRDGGIVDLWADMRWEGPGCLLNDAGVTAPGKSRSDGTGIRGVHLLTPETATSTHYLFCASRWNPISHGAAIDADVRQRLSDLRRHAFENQDQVILDAQQRAMLDPAINTARTVFLDVDAGPSRFLRMLDELVEKESPQSAPPATGEVDPSGAAR
jgi:vanillate O-demethylase monooxygenase subunit